MKKYEVPFSDAIAKKLDDLPDHVLQSLNTLTGDLLITALMDHRTQTKIDPNIALAAMQKALSLLIAKFFPEDKVPEITDIIAKNLKENAIEGAKTDV